MRARWTGWLALAVLVLGGYLYTTEWRADRPRERTRAAHRILAFHADDVEAIEIDPGGERIRAERVEGVWRLTHPVEAAADPAAIRHLLSGFDLLERMSVISRADRESLGQGLDAFGLDRPHARWTFWTPTHRQALWLGRPTADGERVYLFDESTEEVIAVSGEVLRLLPLSSEAVRDRVLFTVDPFRVHRLELTRPEGFVQFARGPAGEWRLQQPLAARADPGAVRGLIALLVDARAAGFVREGPGEDAHFGFDETAVSAALSVDRPEPATQRIEFGFQPPDRSDVRYARLSGRPGIVTVPETVYRNVRTSIQELRDRRLVTFGPEAVHEVRIGIGDDELTLMRGDAGWRLTHPVAAVADGQAVDALLHAWTGARTERFIDAREAGEDDAPGEASRRIAFRISGPDEPGERTVTFTVGSPDEHGMIPVRRKDSDQRGTIHPLRLRGFSTDPAVYISARPLQVAPEHVRGFTTRHARLEWTVTVAPDGLLAFSPNDQALDPVMARNQLALLVDLPTVGIAARDDADDDPFGLDDPVALIRIHLSEAAGSGRTLSVGRRDDDGVFVRVGGQDVVYRVDPVVAEALCRRPTAEAGTVPDGG